MNAMPTRPHQPRTSSAVDGTKRCAFQKRVAPPAVFAVAKTAGGATLFWNAHRFVPSTAELVLGWCGLVGIAFMLHFGLFHLLSCCWRSLGVEAPPLMNHPWASTS